MGMVKGEVVDDSVLSLLEKFLKAEVMDGTVGKSEEEIQGASKVQHEKN